MARAGWRPAVRLRRGIRHGPVVPAGSDHLATDFRRVVPTAEFSDSGAVRVARAPGWAAPGVAGRPTSPRYRGWVGVGHGPPGGSGICARQPAECRRHRRRRAYALSHTPSPTELL